MSDNEQHLYIIENQKVWQQYEYQIYESLCKELVNENDAIFLHKDIPPDHLIASGLAKDWQSILKDRRYKKINNINPLQDIGVDILLYKNGKYIFVQCKCGYKNGLTISDLSGFNAIMANHENKEGIVYYTDKLSSQLISIQRTNRIKYIEQPLKIENNNIEHINQNNFTLYDYQMDALYNLKQ